MVTMPSSPIETQVPMDWLTAASAAPMPERAPNMTAMALTPEPTTKPRRVRASFSKCLVMAYPFAAVWMAAMISL
jgi:hypothetical protein